MVAWFPLMAASESRALAACVLVLAFLATWAPAVQAEPRAAARVAAGEHSDELEHTAPSHLAFELAGSVVLSTSLLLAAGPPATRCGWCASDAFDESVRDALRARHPRTAAALSHAFSVAAAPALALGALLPSAFMRGRPSHALEDSVIVLDAVILTFGVTHGTKRLLDRERPAVHHGVAAATEYAGHPSEWNQSFFSSDTSLAFALGSSAATLAYLRGYRVAPWIVFAGSVIGVSTACLRVAADMHWATDVLTGAAVGTAIGFSLPYFMHGRSSDGPRPGLLNPNCINRRGRARSWQKTN